MPCKRRATKCTLKFYGRVAANGALCRMPEAVTQIGWMSECPAQDNRMRGWAHPGCQTMMMTRHIRDDYDDASRTGGAVGRVDDPSSCPLDAHYSQLKLMQRPAVLSPVRSSRSLSLSLSFSLSLSLSLVSLSLSHCCCPSALFFVLSRDSFFLKR